MTNPLQLVFQYRQRLGACEAGAGLSFEEIGLVSTVEARFAVDAPTLGSRRWLDRPLLGMEPVQLTALLRGRKVCDRVGVVAFGPKGLICTEAPYMPEGESFEVIIDDPARGLSYRFSAKAIWSEEDEDGELEVELAFTGVPVMVRYGENATRPASHGDDLRASSPKPQALVVDSDDSFDSDDFFDSDDSFDSDDDFFDELTTSVSARVSAA